MGSGLAAGQEDQSFTLDSATLDGFVHSDGHAFQDPTAGINTIDLFPSGAPLVDPSTDLIQGDDPLAVFTQFYALPHLSPSAHLPNHVSPMYGGPAWSPGEIPTPLAGQGLDLVFSPMGATSEVHGRSEEPRDGMNGRGFTDGQEGERYEEGMSASNDRARRRLLNDSLVSSATAVRPFSPATAQIVRQFIHSAHATPERPIRSTDYMNVGQVTDTLPSWLWAHVPTLLDVRPL